MNRLVEDLARIAPLARACALVGTGIGMSLAGVERCLAAMHTARLGHGALVNMALALAGAAIAVLVAPHGVAAVERLLTRAADRDAIRR